MITHEDLNENKYTLNFQIRPPQYKIITKNQLKIIKFIGCEDESKSGEFVNPSKDLLIPIPVNSHPKITLAADKKISIKGRPTVNPIIEITGDSIVNYKYLDLPVKYEKKDLFKIKGFLWVGNHYCIHIKINLSEYDLPSNTTYMYDSFTLTLLFKNTVKENNIPAKKGSDIQDKYLVANIFESNTGKPNYTLNSSDSWIDYTKDYLKIGVAKDAIYRIYPQDLSALGIDASRINPLTFKLINKGKELPVFVHGEDDSHFDSKDFIEFVGIRNMGGHHREVAQYGHPYNEYLGRYTDTSIYWLTWGGDFGKRVIVSTGDSQLNPVDTLKYYNQIVHNEINNWFDFSMADLVRREMPYWWENKSWFEGQISVGTRARNFNVSDVYPGQAAKIFIKVQDYASNIYTDAHLLSLSLNSEPAVYDSDYVNKYETKVFSAEVNSNLLQEGKNTLYIHYYPTEANPNTCQIDWDEEEYPRYLKAIGDSLNFQFNYLTNSLVKAITVTNIDSSNIIYWKYGGSYKKYELNVQNSRLTLTDTVDSGNKFILVNDQKISKPEFYYVKKFRNLRSSQNSAQYIAITNKMFLNECSDYIQFISQNYNISTASIDVDDIYDEFAYGYFNPESIRDFLKAADNYWQDPKPKYVFLIGAANYDYYGNKVKNFGAPPKYNLVPSFGFPVSDTWFVIWDTTGANIPQMDIGRLPAKNIQEFQHYFDKHKNYLAKGFDEWNKRYIFFSGGNFTDTSQIGQLKRINDFIIDNYIAPAPVGGEVSHFYKTVNPVTNFGPYTSEQIQSAINNGGVFISYLGHSGTETWDNSITDPSQLKNNIDRNPVITDYGCSTAKFAEPDITSFSELTVNGLSGQAIAYIGNSSLGFTSTSYVFPQIFFKTIFNDSVYNIGDAHRLAKIELLNKYGSSGSYQLFTLTNTLVGDPVINVPIPPKANLSILPKDIHIAPASPSDNNDSIEVNFNYKNLGEVINDSVDINIDDEYISSKIFQKTISRKIPLYIDSLKVPIVIKNKPGIHTVSITLDRNQKIDELTKADNKAAIQVNVLTSSLRNTSLYNIENQTDGIIKFINPSLNTSENNIIIDIGTDKDFTNSSSYTIPFDSFYTKYTVDPLYYNSRIWLRAEISGAKAFGQIQSFFVGKKNGYLLNDSISFSTSNLNNLKIYKNKISADTAKVILHALSAGFSDGNTAIISENNQNFIPENTLRGHHICLFDGNTLNFVQYKKFDVLSGGSEITNYINFLDTLSNKYIIIIAVSDEGLVSSSALKSEIKSIGSKYIDSLKFRGSWCIIGRKGAVPGSVPEAVSDPFQGRVQIDTSISLGFNYGNMATSRIGPVKEWKNLKVTQSIPSGSAIKYRPIGIRSNGVIDTLNYLSVVNGTADLNGINANTYPYLKIFAEFSINKNSISPVINTLNVNYSELPELGTNYQAVSLSKDSLIFGESENLQFYVYNVGGSPADSFKVNVDVVNSDNVHKTIFNTIIDSLNPNSRREFKVDYNTISGTGSKLFYISIDPDNRIPELYKDNNVFDIPFYVQSDTSRPTLNVTFDGINIMDGDYVSSNPKIKIELYDNSHVPITDTSAAAIYLNGNPVYYASNQSSLTYTFNSANPKFVATYVPALKDGEYDLKIIGKNSVGTLADSAGYNRAFTVMGEAKLINVYNYPNPFSKDTYFTFKLTQIPDELKIRIYTVAGRLVKEIKKHASDLNYDFNKIYWDGRDQDGDMLANGVYFYKITLVKGDKKDNIIQKIAIVR